MSLADYGGKYFSVGKFPVSISALRFYTCNTGTKGVEFAFTNGQRDSKISFVLHEKALWKLAQFAEACGMTMDEMRTIDPAREQSMSKFVGRRFVAVFAKEVSDKDGKEYTNCVDFEAIGSAPSCPPPSARSPQPQETYTKPGYTDEPREPQAAHVSDGAPVDDADIPF